jgi:CheY-like chemotaxis protein
MEQLTQIDDAHRTVNEILRRVDRLIKEGDVEGSLREIIRAKEICPKHGYIGAYEERLAYLKVEHEKNIAAERTRKEAEEAARKRDEELRQEHEKERKRLEKKQKHEDAKWKREEERIEANPERSQQSEASDDQSRETTGAESSGVSSGNRVAESSQLYSEGSSKNGGEVILVIDDDEQMRDMLSHALTAEGYEVRTLECADDAFVLLKSWTPGLILCDVNLETSTMGGFSFYEKVRTLDDLHDVPFIFLTGMNDDVMVRTAKELGADDYLMKPVSLENLLSTIKGKLKRFGSFREKP